MCRLAFVAFACLALGQASAEALQPAADDPRLNAALAALKPQRPGTVDAYVIVAALDTDPVFNREAREAGRVLAERFGAEGRARADAWTYTPEEYADRVVELVARAVGARRT